jgi:hypothetical protein
LKVNIALSLHERTKPSAGTCQGVKPARSPMKWFRKSLVWASIGCFGASASAQSVSLGRPTPLPAEGQPGQLRLVSAFMPIQPSVVRAAAAYPDDEPKSLLLPRDLPSLTEPSPAAPGSNRDTGAKPTQAITNGEVKILLESPQEASQISSVSTTGTTMILPEEPCNTMLDWGVRWSSSGDGRFYARGEWLLWRSRGMQLPPLVTTAAPTDPEATRGALGFDSTRVIYGNNATSTGPTSGARFTAGYTLDDCGLVALEGNYFFLGGKNDNAFFNSNQFPVLGRPFFDINDGVQSRQLTTSPGIVPGDLLKSTGSIAVNTASSLMGAELNLRGVLWIGCDYKINGLVGVRYLNLSEQLNITEHALILQDIPVNPPNVPFRTSSYWAQGLNAGVEFRY